MPINNRMSTIFLMFFLIFPMILSADESLELRHCVQVFDYPKTSFALSEMVNLIDSYDVCISKTSSKIEIKDQTIYQKGAALPINSIFRFTDGTILNLYVSKGNENFCSHTMPIYLTRTKSSASGVGCLLLDYGYKKSIINVYVKYFISTNNSLTNISSLLETTVSVRSVRCKDGKVACKDFIPLYESTAPKEKAMH